MVFRLFLFTLFFSQTSCKTASNDAGASVKSTPLSDCDGFGGGVAFSCIGETTGSDKLKGIFIDHNTGSDDVILTKSGKFRVFDDAGSTCLILKRDVSPLKSGVFSDFDIQFLNTQSLSGLGKSKTRLSTPLGTFGGRSGFKFKAALTVTSDGYDEGVDVLHKLNCKLD
ncbi:MAG: hypothetical protein NTV34_05690 [Proteobacteria bacterium]|nr:hypothetical protein [Pseudomonadota bacterium]